MTGQFSNKYRDVMRVKITTLESMGAWGFFDQKDDTNLIQLTWALKCKLYLGGLIKNLPKINFFARGNQQLEGINFFETYAPLVQWTAV